MRGDETRPETAGGGQVRERSGPRHAAPRKSLLTKLQIPAGKAFALAAMPTAVFVGMGLTPRLALAEDAKDIPFAPGPCVTRSDEPPEESASPSPSEKPSDDPSGDPSGDATDKPKPPAGGDGDDAPEPSPGETPPASDAQKPAAPKEPEPEPSKSRDPLDPLGLGDALGGLLGVPDKDEDEPAPDKPADPEPEKPGADKPADPEPDKETGAEKPGGADSTEDAIRDAADKAGADVEELDDAAKGLEARKDDDIPEGADGKPRFPCPEADPEALAAAELEPGIPLLPDDPWRLESTKLTLRGLDYHGIVEVKTGSGKIKKALKFTASEVDIKDLHQKVVYPEGRTAHVASRPDSTSTIREGQVTMYTEELKGNLFGLIPITFSPETPPPLNVPFAFFTDVEVLQAGQFGGTLTVPGLHNYITG